MILKRSLKLFIAFDFSLLSDVLLSSLIRLGIDALEVELVSPKDGASLEPLSVVRLPVAW